MMLVKNVKYDVNLINFFFNFETWSSCFIPSYNRHLKNSEHIGSVYVYGCSQAHKWHGIWRRVKHCCGKVANRRCPKSCRSVICEQSDVGWQHGKVAPGPQGPGRRNYLVYPRPRAAFLSANGNSCLIASGCSVRAEGKNKGNTSTNVLLPASESIYCISRKCERLYILWLAT